MTAVVMCPWGCGWEGTPEEFLKHYEVCPKRVLDNIPSNQPTAIRSLIELQTDCAGNIVYPLGKSPLKVYDVCTGGKATDSLCLVKVVSDLYEAERVAYTQYAEVFKIKALEKFYPDIKHIQDEEYEHMQLLAKILNAIGYEITTQI